MPTKINTTMFNLDEPHAAYELGRIEGAGAIVDALRAVASGTLGPANVVYAIAFIISAHDATVDSINSMADRRTSNPPTDAESVPF